MITTSITKLLLDHYSLTADDNSLGLKAIIVTTRPPLMIILQDLKQSFVGGRRCLLIVTSTIITRLSTFCTSCLLLAC